MSPVTPATVAAHAQWVEAIQTPHAIATRFWENVDKAGECWTWTAGTNGRYGKFRLPGREAYAHRVAYEWERGPIPAGLTIDHLCENPLCVRPDHMQVVTQAINNAMRGHRKTRCPHGHDLLVPENCYFLPGGYRRCRICSRAQASARRGAVQCAGEGANGDRCRRRTARSSGRCHAHEGAP